MVFYFEVPGAVFSVRVSEINFKIILAIIQ